jgi:hypothetical protein
MPATEEVIYKRKINDDTMLVVRHMTTARGLHSVDVRTFFLPSDQADLPADEQGWVPTKKGVRLDHADLAEVAKIKLPKNPTDTKTVTTRIDNSIKLGA